MQYRFPLFFHKDQILLGSGHRFLVALMRVLKLFQCFQITVMDSMCRMGGTSNVP